MIKKIFKYSIITAIISLLLSITGNIFFLIPFYISMFLFLISSILLLETIGNKQCPYCQEWINKKAIKCPHCQSNIK